MFILSLSRAWAQRLQVLDAGTKQPLPFATIKFGNGAQGTVADINGYFDLGAAAGFQQAEVAYIGYMPLKLALPYRAAVLQLLLQRDDNSLKEVVVAPPYDKMRYVLNRAIANRDLNNPDKYDAYQCHVYYKMVASDELPDTTTRKKKTDKHPKKLSEKQVQKKLADQQKDSTVRAEMKQFLDSNNIIVSETYSVRTWQRPQQLQEDVIGTRFSGLHKNILTSMVTDVLPFHAYYNYITLNGKDYHNPVSAGFFNYYDFNLTNELMQGKDTVWELSFKPNGNKSNQLRGVVYINSNGYAIERLIATAHDSGLNQTTRIEQQYKFTPDTKTGECRWFPEHLNYIIDWKIVSTNGASNRLYMKGHTDIDATTWHPASFKFDKLHTVKLREGSDELSDSAWNKLRPEALNHKELHTYTVMDSLGDKYHFDKFAEMAGKAGINRLPIGFLDFDYSKFITANPYEGTRLGIGAQTNEKVIPWISAGGWGDYGTRDAHWKYGFFGELYGNRSHETVLRFGYSDDINDPGRIRLNHDLDKNYLNSFLLSQVDEVKSTFGSLRKKFGYWSFELSARQQDITPKYNYAFVYDGIHTQYSAAEASMSWRYAFAERTSPIMGFYYSLGSRYPMWYGKITTGTLTAGSADIPYTQAVTAGLWHKHINRMGFEHILLEGGKSWSNGALPLSKLFAGSGFNYGQGSLYTFGGLMTINPYEYYTDKFAMLIFRHDFDWKLFTAMDKDIGFGSAPYISLGYNMLYGTLAHPEAQVGPKINIPDPAYQEFGLLLNSLARLRYYGVYYLTLNLGYYYHPVFNGGSGAGGKYVIGAGVEL